MRAVTYRAAVESDPEEYGVVNPRSSDIEQLEALDLTGRQAEVAFWVAQGKTNDDLAIILGVSRRTIAHHVEDILLRLQLTTRAEIMLRTLEALGWLRWPAERSTYLGNSAHIQNPSRTSQS